MMPRVPIMNARATKALKAVHIMGAAATFGGLLSIMSILLMKNGMVQPDPSAFTYDRILLGLHAWAVTYPFVAVVVTSLIYGLFTEWGLVRHYWIIAKWGMVLALLGVTMLGLGPSLSGMASISDTGFHMAGMVGRYAGFQQRALITTAIELAGLAVLFLVSVTKPWGRQKRFDISPRLALTVLLPAAAIGGVCLVMNVMMLNGVRSMAIDTVDLASVSDEVHEGGTTAGHYEYSVAVTVRDHRITAIRDLNPRRSVYADYARGVFNRIIKNQKADVDAITGATTTSKAYMKAVGNALTGAKGI